jgi:methyltransferase (TIGR00027 family)
MAVAIEHVSDTARWVAVYRAMESERPDAHFRDPWARRLAGVKGEDIVRTLPRGRGSAWPMIVRTKVFDEIIHRLVQGDRLDLVVNLAAGLDTRPWRMELPADLVWMDVDLPGILDYKLETMAAEIPRCRYQAVRADLTDAGERAEALARVADAERAMVVSEGLLVYLGDANVGELARALHAQPSLRWWLTDLASPRLLKMMRRSWGAAAESGGASFLFAPEAGSAFFQPYGWREAEWHSTWEDARRLGRRMRGAWIWDLLGRLQSRRRRERWQRFAGNLLLERA